MVSWENKNKVNKSRNLSWASHRLRRHCRAEQAVNLIIYFPRRPSLKEKKRHSELPFFVGLMYCCLSSGQIASWPISFFSSSNTCCHQICILQVERRAHSSFSFPPLLPHPPLHSSPAYFCGPVLSFSTAWNASWGTATLPMVFILFFPLACFWSSFFFRLTSPP